jgi:predicted kinase
LRVAKRLAAFHAGARRISVTVAGVPALAVERRMTANFHELLTLADQRSQVDRVLALERFSHAFVVSRGYTFDRRARQGFVREVHGDLRAEHVLLGGRVDVVDCIEFDRAFRDIDVADDLAFLVMDLEARGGGHWAATLLEAYRAAGGDAGDDQLAAFYACYRALVRAKVALLRCAQHPPASAEHARETAAARDLLALAERFAWRARLPLAIVVCGVPASGKTHFARVLSDLSGLPHLSSDVTRKQLAGVPRERRAPANTYSEDFNRQTYAELARRASAEVRLQGGAIVDGTFRHRVDRAAFREAFGNAGPTLFVECQAPQTVLAERARGRKRGATSASDATPDIVLREREAWDPLDEVDAEAHVVLRTDRSVDRLVEDLRAVLDERLRRLTSAPATRTA